MLYNDSAAWIFYTKASFVAAVGMVAFGLVMMPVEMWIKAYFAMATVFVVGATFTLAKTMRDQHEFQKLHNKLDQAKTEKLLKEYEATA